MKTANQLSDLPSLLSVPESAKLLKVSRVTAHGWVVSGRLRSVKIGGRYLVFRDGVESLRAARRREFADRARALA